MERARRHQTFLARLALALLVLVAELVGRSLTHRVNIGRHVEAPSYSGAEYYPFLLVAVKVGVALLLARIAWRFVKARSVASGAQRLLRAHGRSAERVPRMRAVLSPRLWLCCFLGTSLIYLLQTDAERVSTTGQWPLFAAWLHSSALPVFAVLSVVVAVVYGAVARWLADYEHYARAVAERASRLGVYEPATKRPKPCVDTPPRGRFGVAFEVRPPPVVA
ncbi:MAG: hypothetical protein E6G50_09125 [Actinobacteria bacterium]|nr:MAG: hypothetical protein E6G50_09125 [Actinomycetota bacterium]